MISSNGGTWSHIAPEFNNQVKTFKFGKGDTVRVQVSYITDTVKFKNIANSQTYSLKFKKNEKDLLYPCCMFYYMNDTLEFKKVH